VTSEGASEGAQKISRLAIARHIFRPLHIYLSRSMLQRGYTVTHPLSQRLLPFRNRCGCIKLTANEWRFTAAKCRPMPWERGTAPSVLNSSLFKAAVLFQSLLQFFVSYNYTNRSISESVIMSSRRIHQLNNLGYRRVQHGDVKIFEK